MLLFKLFLGEPLRSIKDFQIFIFNHSDLFENFNGSAKKLKGGVDGSC